MGRMDPDLYETVVKDDIHMLKEMEKRLSIGDQRTPTNSTVLHLACQYGSMKCLEQILSVHTALLLRKNTRGETALHLAARQGVKDTIIWLQLSFKQLSTRF